MKNIFTQYAEVSAQIKKLEAEKKGLSDVCLSKMKEDKQESFKNELGTFTITKRSYYTYSPKVKDAEDKVKLLKKVEEQQGIAEEKVSEGIMFRGKTEEAKE